MWRKELSEILSINLRDESLTIPLFGANPSSSWARPVLTFWRLFRGQRLELQMGFTVSNFLLNTLYTSTCVTWLEGNPRPGWELVQSLEPHSMIRSRTKITCPRDICRNNISVKQLHNIIIFEGTLWGLRQITGHKDGIVCQKLPAGPGSRGVSAVLKFLHKDVNFDVWGSIAMASAISN